MKTLKIGFFTGSLTGILILILTHIFMPFLPNTGPMSFFSKIYHITQLLTGLAWNYNIQPALDLSAKWLAIYRFVSFTLLYSFVFGVLGIVGACIVKLPNLKSSSSK